MLYVSELTGQSYKTEKECLVAEKEFQEALDAEKARKAELKAKEEKLKAERAARAKEVEEARAKVVEAEKNYRQLLKKFTDDYNSYHMTITTKEMNDAIEEFFKLF